MECTTPEFDTMIDDQVRKTLKYVLAHSKDREWEINQDDLDKVDRQFDLKFLMNDGAGNDPKVFVKLRNSAGHLNRRKISITMSELTSTRVPVKAKQKPKSAKPVVAKKSAKLTDEQKRQKENERKRLYRLRKKAEKQAATKKR